MKLTYRWLGFTLALLASIGMVLIPAAPADAAVAANQRQITLRTYDVVVASFRNDGAIHKQLTAKVARLTPGQFQKVVRATKAFEARINKSAKRVSENGQASEFSSQAKRPQVTVTKTPTLLERVEAFLKALQGALPLAALFIPAAAALTPVVVFILVIVSAVAAIAKGYEELQKANASR
jgi:hypothetical protein